MYGPKYRLKLIAGLIGAVGIHFSALAEYLVAPWDLEALKANVPEMTWLRQDQPIHSLTYAGEKVNGRDTEVFAFYASPATLGKAAEDESFPGIVLIHGGGGTAFAQWVHLWAKRGYAAIAMDLSGSRPVDPVFDEKTGEIASKLSGKGARRRLEKGGLNHGHPEKFDSIGGDTSDDWPFHAVASVMRAHSLIRSFPEVDENRTAVTGISWGGYTTCLSASLDDRFKAAVPVYGCGFLHEGESVQKPSIDKLGDRKNQWVKLYDPGSHLDKCKVPILFVNGTNDKHYVLDSYMKSYSVVPGEKHIRIQHKMAHGHPAGWAPKEIGIFIDSKCLDQSAKPQPLPVVGEPKADGDSIQVECQFQNSSFKAAKLYYTTDKGLRAKRNWQALPAKVVSGGLSGEVTIAAPKPPQDANTWYIEITDNRDAMVSTVVRFQ